MHPKVKGGSNSPHKVHAIRLAAKQPSIRNGMRVEATNSQLAMTNAVRVWQRHTLHGNSRRESFDCI